MNRIQKLYQNSSLIWNGIDAKFSMVTTNHWSAKIKISVISAMEIIEAKTVARK